ncbi:teicoplanin resistance protein VanZ [Candidatus Pacearchaeota archaeon]|nr:teicoplanin resistance protein VanZ [Candidatus Pacearchaeota archaeon]|tara:strand:+ start:408 stop:782 length:375 start_codon:yes stop_codon:yes gene_type:complete
MIRFLEKNSIISWIITLVIASTIFYLSSKTFEGTSKTGYLSIVYHFFAFFFLALFLLISSTKGNKNKRSILIISIILTILYGISDEFHQYFVPGRSSSLFDILTNSVGILTASNLYYLRMRFRR